MDRDRRLSLPSYGIKLKVCKIILFRFLNDSIKGYHILRYASVVINGDFFIVGGRYNTGDSMTAIIARLDATTWSWSRAGQLNTARSHHAAIWFKSKLVVVGGRGEKPTEFCELIDNQFTCVDQNSTLEDYFATPLLLTVSDDFRNC